MSRDSQRVYRRIQWKRVLPKAIALVIAAAFLLAVIFYVWFRRYIVYTDTGLYLDIPWLADVRGK